MFYLFCLLFVVFIPLLSSILVGLRPRFLYCRYDHPIFLSVLLLFLPFLISVYLFLTLPGQFSHLWQLTGWFYSLNYTVFWSFLLDAYSCYMFLIITTVSLCVHIYSISYMRGDPHICRFFSLLSLFTFFMLLLVSSGNLVQLFIGWEGVGLCSFLLIGFWTERALALKSAIKAMVINKVGDCCFLLGVALLFQKLGAIDLGSLKTLDIGSYYYLLLSENFFGFEVSGAFPALLFLFLGVMAKSAQFGFHTWLPDAMEGPTPVSALIHAATMVTAGVFLLLRVSSLVVLSSSIQLIITTVGLLTMVFAATSALFQNDIKRVIAYSTCSQLGYMIAACGYSFFGAAFFHLLSHAFFKALLFLCAGSIIHYFSDEQDMRRIWSVPLRTVTAVCLSVSSLSLMGFPFTSGFFSKDYILELLASQGFHAAFGYSVGLSAAVLTVAYSILLMLRVWQRPIQSFYFEGYTTAVPLIALFFFSTFFGYGFWSSYAQLLPSSMTISAPILTGFKVLPLLAILFGSVIAWYFFSSPAFQFSSFSYSIYRFFSSQWYFNRIYSHFFIGPSFYLSHLSYFGLERGWIEILGPSGITTLLTFISKFINRLQTGSFVDYLSLIFISLLSYACF